MSKQDIEARVFNQTLSPSRSMDSQLNNISVNMALQTPVSAKERLVTSFVFLCITSSLMNYEIHM